MKKLFIGFLFLIFSVSAFTQDFGLGYVANIPSAPLGVNFYYHQIDKPIGLYIDFKMGNSGDKNGAEYYENIHLNTAIGYGDAQISDYSENYVFDVGATFKISNSILFYGALGYVYSKDYLVFKDNTYILGNDGKYSVDAEEDGSALNVAAGLIIKSNAVYFTVGGDLEPAGVTAGVGFTF